MAILLEAMVFLMKSRDSAEEDEDEDVNFQRREVSNTVAAITDNTVLAEAIDDDDWDLKLDAVCNTIQNCPTCIRPP